MHFFSSKQRHPHFPGKHRADNTMEKSSKNAVEGGFNKNPGREVRVHLFNCDKTYNLDSVEELFCEVKDGIGKKLRFDIELPIRKSYFSLSKMSEMRDTTIPKLQMDLAVFVVHAHESGYNVRLLVIPRISLY